MTFGYRVNVYAPHLGYDNCISLDVYITPPDNRTRVWLWSGDYRRIEPFKTEEHARTFYDDFIK